MHNKNKDSGSNVQLALHYAWVSAASRLLTESCIYYVFPGSLIMGLISINIGRC